MGLIGNIQSALFGLIFLSAAACFTPFAAFNLVFIKRRPQDIFSFDKFGSAIFTLFWSKLGNTPQKASQDKLDVFFSQARGVVLDLGPGAGFTVKNFHAPSVTKIFGVEPNLDFHPQLIENIRLAGLQDIYTVVGCGVEDFATLAKYGIEEGSMDTVVACKVLCSVPRPKDICKALYKLVAPGGSLIALEHCKSENGIASKLQNTLNYVWTFFLAGCNINRPTYAYLLDAGPWEKKTMRRPEGSYDEELLPFIDAKFTKAK